MKREKVSYDRGLVKTLKLLADPGLLLVSSRGRDQANAMIIGWATVGVLWGKPVFVTLVRPSRHTFGLIEASGLFTVNVPTEEMQRWVGVCGTQSGRDVDKFGAYGVARSPGQMVDCPTIDDSPMVYECRVVHTNDVLPETLNGALDASSYPSGDYHRMYYGEILGAFAAEGY